MKVNVIFSRLDGVMVGMPMCISKCMPMLHAYEEETFMIDQPGPYDDIPDVRDGLTRKERAVLVCLKQAQEELGGRNVPTALLYGRVVEHVDMSVEELQQILQRFVGVHGGG